MSPDTDSPPDSFYSLLVVGSSLLGAFTLAETTGDVFAMYLSAEAFGLAVAVAYGVLAWAFLERVDPNRRDFLTTAIGLPVVFFFVVPLLTLVGHGETALYLFGDRTSVSSDTIGGLFFFVVAFGVAGVAATRVSEAVHRYVDGRSHRPSARTLATASVTLLGVAALGLVVANHAAAGSVAVADLGMERGSADAGRPAPSLDVTLEGGPATVRVHVTDPDGNRFTERLSRGALADGTETLSFGLHTSRQDRLTLTPGEYRVTVTTASGATVSDRTYSLDPVSLDSGGFVAEAEADRGEYGWSVNESRSAVGTDGTVVVVVENPAGDRGDTNVGLLGADGTVLDEYGLRISPYDRFGVVLSLSDDELATVDERADGRAVVRVSRDGETVLEVPIAVPEPGSTNESSP
ncbi:hypothetical protein [Halomarina rubra]|uniref:Uncharacterized protein n=1 Tax=Halomarina rubra TaxID=2071873 RepID=A0ABD6AX67_9EURY|nr:hypothetical protein [Halomarina rubra]